MFQRFIDFVLRYKVYITFSALSIISLSLISMGGSTRAGGLRTVVIGSIGWLQSMFSWVPNPGAMKSENQSLRELNLRLSNEVTRMRRALLENKSLRQTIDFRNIIDDPYVLAEIVGKTTVQLSKYISVDKGLKDGIKEGMAVRNDAGLVGSVIGCSEHYSFIELIVNPEVRIAGQVLSSHIDGVLAWEGGNTFMMKNIPKNSGVELEDIVITSNYSNKYPERIPVGKIVKIVDDPGGVFLKVYVESLVDFSSLEQVFVLKYLPDPELENMIKNIDEKLKIRKEKSQK
jgi:rod shape-determining protein MreC